MERDEFASISRLFGERVRLFRKVRGLSQEELAELAGLDRTYVGGIERGERNPSLKNLCRLSKALMIPTEALFQSDPPEILKNGDECY